MRAIGLSGIFFLIFSLISSTSTSWGAQVVTEEGRLWAKKVLEEEKALETLRGSNTLTVLYFRNTTGQEGLNPIRKGLTLMLITDLTHLKGLQVIERIKLQALLEEMRLGEAGLVEPDTEPRIGSLLGAEWLVGGDIMGDASVLLRIDSKLLDIPTSQVLGQPGAEGQLSELFRIEKELLFGIIELLRIEITPEEREILERPCSTNTEALINLFQGIDASDHGDYEQAAAFYEKALQDDPEICSASEAIEELRALGLIITGKKSRGMLHTLRGRISLTDQYPDENALKRINEPDEITTPVQINLEFPE
jgi:TolB-like protein